MEDVVSEEIQQLLPDAAEVPFANITEALARGRDPGKRTTPPRTLTATVVAVCSRERLARVAATVAQLGASTAVRAILICEGSETRPKSFVSGDTVAIESLRPIFINNAVAALRLSSLPTLVWWSGCSPDLIDDLAHLADRVVMDDPDPLPVWKQAVEFFDHVAFSDLRWTRLTRWRALMAHMPPGWPIRSDIRSTRMWPRGDRECSSTKCDCRTRTNTCRSSLPRAARASWPRRRCGTTPRSNAPSRWAIEATRHC
jgi:hypothetical protein